VSSTADQALDALALRLGRALRTRGWRIATAESCTGGWIAKVLTDIPGSSQWFESGVVTYSNAAKIAVLGVPSDVLAVHGAVSEAAARAMVEGALARLGAQAAVAVTGIAGPDGGTTDKPVGTVWFAWAGPNGTRAERRNLRGEREAVRRQCVAYALDGLLALVGPDEPRA
jgi:nicotinamide-nucleotide amidase